MNRRRPTINATESHRAWLELVDRDGPFIAVPVLKRIWPQGIAPLRQAARAALRDAKPDFDRAWDAWSRATAGGGVAASGTDDVVAALADYRGARDKFVTAVLGDVAGWDAYLTWDLTSVSNPSGTTGVPSAFSPDRASEVHATGAFVREDSTGPLVLVVDPVASLRDPYDDVWSASPIDRMDILLRATGHPTGIVTDGRWWAIVSAPSHVPTASGIVDAQTWIEETRVCDAFFTLIEPRRLVGGSETDRLPALFAESVAAAEEITLALGTQVRQAVELLVTALSEAVIDARAAGRPDPLPADRGQVYDGAVTMMMRAVFLLFAEERAMMPQTPLFTEAYGIADQLDILEARFTDENAEALDATHHTWHRLLATSRALYEGVNTEDMRLPAYGGSLFDTTRFGFLAETSEDGSLVLAVSDRVMREVLRSVQYATVGKAREYRRISFRDIDVEQIGYIYEGLLGYTAVEATEVMVGLLGKDGKEPEAPLALLEELWEESDDDSGAVEKLRAWMKKNQPAAVPATAGQFKKALTRVPDDAERALLSVTRDENLLARLRPYVGVIRRDLRDRPLVIQPGGLIVVETPSRANAGAHYTPKSLAQEVVLHALEPLVYSPGPHDTDDRDQWKLIRWNKILDLKVADIACGSGAFLVAAAEYLAGKLVEAWHSEGIATGSAHDLQTRARRQVVANCLYGADINAMAVEMCKLSLWLVSLDPGQPFSFVDDKVLHGNSLLGIVDPRQIEALHIDPERSRTFQGDTGQASAFSAGTLFGEGSEANGVEMLDIRGVLRDAAELRRDLASPIDENDPARSAKTKQRLWSQYQDLTARAATVADGVIATGLKHGGKPGKKLDEAYDTLRIAVDKAFTTDGGDPDMLHRIVDTGLTPEVSTDYERWKPLHWALAVPDVLGTDGSGGFDAVIGNPPFLGGQKLTGSMGTDVRDWFVHTIADGRRGSADLVAYFFLRATSLLTGKGTLGLIATNTVGQGDTREVGLDAMVASGFTITRAIQSRPWPADSANLEYAAVWGTVRTVSDDVARVADEVRVRSISPLLEPAGRATGNPARLPENADIAYIGCYVLGMGFVLEEAEAQEWIAADPKNAEVLFPYLNGEDLNQRPDSSASRWVIDFNDRDEGEAAKYSLPFRRALEEVKPERMRNSRKARREYWWKFAERAPKLRQSIAALPEILVIARVSKTVMPLRVRTGQIASEATVVFATDDYSLQAVLSSSLHQLWAITYGSGMRNDPRYTPSDVFETFPLPVSTTRLTEVGRVLDQERREIMLHRDLGLTKLYNLVNDPEVQGDVDVARLRQVHKNLDEIVVDAFGWDDVHLEHGFHSYRQMMRWTVRPSVRTELLDRLLEENQRRAGRSLSPRH